MKGVASMILLITLLVLVAFASTEFDRPTIEEVEKEFCKIECKK